jgi:Zn-dependent peptidase ImmA (M78 family)/transcriptional regulator with XRE-family HTH domain
MMSDEFNADMLDLARGARGMTQAEVAQAAGVSQAMLSKVENRLMPPTQELAERLAEALQFPVKFFYQAERTIGFPHYHHRKRASLGSKALAKVHAIINIRRQHIARLLKSYGEEVQKPIPSFDLDEKGASPADAARMVREYWLLPRGPVDNVTDAIESAGGIVVLTDFGTSALDGLSFRAPGLPPIFVMNSEVPGDRYRFSLAHELGHMVMHALPGDDDEKMERQADEFAAAFLMPAVEVRPHLVPSTIEKFARAKPHWKVSIKAMIRRAKDLQLISPDDYRRLSISYSKAGYSRGEPFALPREAPTLLPKMIEFHLGNLGYSTSELSRLLLLHEDDFRRAYLPRPKLELVVSR